MNFETILIYVTALLFSFMLHEIGHAQMAYIRGDDTAKNMGRITLNPIPHIDIFGSLIFPAILLLTKAPILFAWAKPVIINYSKLKNPKFDIPLVSFAGPFVHVILIALSLIIMKGALSFPQLTFGLNMSILEFFTVMIQVNVILMVFNLMPIPPLDGSKIIACLLPDEMARKYMELNPNIGFILIILFAMSGFFGSILNYVFTFINRIAFVFLYR